MAPIDHDNNGRKEKSRSKRMRTKQPDVVWPESGYGDKIETNNNSSNNNKKARAHIAIAFRRPWLTALAKIHT